MKDRATQHLIKYKSGALVTQSETSTIDDVMLSDETKIYPRSLHANQSHHLQIEKLKQYYFTRSSVFLTRTKGIFLCVGTL